MGGKLLQLLTEIAPDVKRAAIMFNPETAPGGGTYFLPSFEAAARSRKVEPIAASVHTDAEIEPIIASLGHEPLSYGPDNRDVFRRAAPYVNRILRGEKPADLPVQLPVKFEMAINVKTVKSLGLTIPETLLATADEVIE